MNLVLSQSTIRSFSTDDAATAAMLLNNRSVSRNMTRIPYPYELRHAEEWVAYATSQTPQTHFAIEVGGKLAGGVGLDRSTAPYMQHSAEIGYWLGEPYWGRGIMLEAVVTFTDWAFSVLGLVRLEAAVYARNAASARVLEKAGYTKEATLRARYLREGERIDGLLFAKVLAPG